MLCISRQLGERVLIAVPGMRETIAIEVLFPGPGSARLGSIAPPAVRIMREELTSAVAADQAAKRAKAHRARRRAEYNAWKARKSGVVA